MHQSIYGWIAIAAFWAGNAAALPPPPQLAPTEEAALEDCLQHEDDEASLSCIQGLNLPLQPEMAELLAMADDAEVEAEYERWRLGFDAAMLDHARALAARGDARSLLAAMMIASPRFDETSGQLHPVSAEQQAWFDAARAVRPADPLVAWLEATGCPVPASQCDTDAAIARLVRIDGDNAAVQWLAINAALDGGDEVAARTHLRVAAQASRFEPYTGEILQLSLETRDAAPLPTMAPATAKVLGVKHDLGRPARNEDLVALQSITDWAAVALPPMSGVMQLCRFEPDPPERDAALRQDCIGLMAQLAASDSILIYPAIALPMLIELTTGPRQASWRSALREYAWVYEQASDLMWPGAARQFDPAEYASWVVAEGELGAMRKLMQRNRIPIEPAADWLPRQPSYRALITTGTAPAG